MHLRFKEAQVLVKKSWVAAVSSVAFLASSCAQGPATNGQATSAGTSVPVAPVTIQCGDGRQALVKQVVSNGQTVSQVDCVAGTLVAPSRETFVMDDSIRVPQPATVAERIVYREAPPQVRRASTSAPRSVPARKKRSGEKSALIIGGSTAAGAGAGALIGGKKGALIGAIVGGLGGTVYDRTTRNPR